MEENSTVDTILKSIEEYYKLVDISTNKIFSMAQRKGGSHVQYNLKEDLYQVGMVALLSAYNNYDTEKKATFTTYAYKRIRGAMLDYLRDEDTVPRTVRSKLKQITVNEEGKFVSDTLTDKQINKAVKQDNRVYQFITLETQEENTGTAGPIEMIDTPQEAIITKETVKKILNNTELTDNERLIINEYYFKGKKFSLIGKELNITESRISQIHKTALNRLHAYASRNKSTKRNTASSRTRCS